MKKVLAIVGVVLGVAAVIGGVFFWYTRAICEPYEEEG